MRVNRIYFRGLKTFQRVFAFSLILAIQPGCVSLGKVRIRAIPVSASPQIIDLEVYGACAQARIFVDLLQIGQADSRLELQQVSDKQGDKGAYRVRVDLSERGEGLQDSRAELRLNIQCPDHADQIIMYPIPDDTFESLYTPDWAKGLVWYQVFPERFRDGNPNNNPNSWDLTPINWPMNDIDPFAEPSIDEIERAWNRRLVDPRKFPYPNGRSGGAVAHQIFARRYGGDLIGLYNQLGSLREQGYTGIYLCPIFQSRSLHKYDADDHRHIDPTLGHPDEYLDPGPDHTRLGPNEDPADESTWRWTVSDRWFVDEFLPKAKSLDLRVVLDGVWNHVGTDHFAFSDVMEFGDQSGFVDWFDVEFDDDGKLIAWKSWGSVNGNLPVFRQTSTGDLAPGPKAHIMAVTKRWMDPNGDGDPSDGIDGWRLDVAGEIGKAFWKDWRSQVREINPEALIIAEIWSDADRMLNDDAFDGQMNYPFAYAVADWLSIGDTKGDAVICAQRLSAVFHHAPQHDLVQFNLMTSHDTERLASMMHNDFVRGYDNDSSRWARGTRYDAHTIDTEDMNRALAAIAVMIASPGSLMIYNGDEYALPGADDPDNRRPIPWDLVANTTSSDLENDMEMRVRFKHVVNELLRLRTEPGFEKVLRFGDAEFIGIDQGLHTGSLLVRRRLGNHMIEFLISSDSESSVELPSWPSAQMGWRVESERSRKFGLEPDSRAIRIRYLNGS